MAPPLRVITCIDCGGRAHLISRFDDEYPEPFPGDVLVYRCEDCLDRWDLVVPDDDADDDARWGDAAPPGSAR